MRPAALRTYRELLQAVWVRERPVGPADETLQRAADILRNAEIPFAIAGGFAVIEHGYERFTKDVDLLVYAADMGRAIDALSAAGFQGRRTPIGARLHDVQADVDLDLLGTAFEGDERALRRSWRAGRLLPVLPLAHLVLMKVEAGRSKDHADVVELLKRGARASDITRYLRHTWPALVPRFQELVAQARAERVTRPRRGPSTKKPR